VKEASKSVKRALHELAAVAYEEELRRALLPLAEAFEAWRSCKLSSGDLAERIHAFNKGTARELFVRYDRRLINHAVARAIVAGIIKRGSVPSEVLDHLAGALEFCESQEAES
jgi:hypothetical protein